MNQNSQVRLGLRALRWPSAPTTIYYAVLVILLILSFFLVVLMLALSVRPSVLIYADFWGLPWPPVWTNYQTALLNLLPPMWRTLWMTIVSIAGVLVVSSLAAYAFARMEFPGKGVLFIVVLAVLMIPGAILLTPQFIVANQLNLRGSLWGLVIFYIAGGLPFGVFLITTFFRSQPVEIFRQHVLTAHRRCSHWCASRSPWRCLSSSPSPYSTLLVSMAIISGRR